jgi:hypothetical protein
MYFKDFYEKSKQYLSNFENCRNKHCYYANYIIFVNPIPGSLFMLEEILLKRFLNRCSSGLLHSRGFYSMNNFPLGFIPARQILRHVATGRDRRLPGKALDPCTISAQQPFRLTVTRIGVKLSTRMRKVIGCGLYR